MDIQAARNLRAGDRITATNHRPGLDGFRPSKVTSNPPALTVPSFTPGGESYIWISTNHGVWPSNRLRRG